MVRYGLILRLLASLFGRWRACGLCCKPRETRTGSTLSRGVSIRWRTRWRPRATRQEANNSCVYLVYWVHGEWVNDLAKTRGQRRAPRPPRASFGFWRVYSVCTAIPIWCWPRGRAGVRVGVRVGGGWWPRARILRWPDVMS